MTGSNPVTFMLLRFTRAHRTYYPYYRTLTFREGGIGDKKEKRAYPGKGICPSVLSAGILRHAVQPRASVAENHQQENDDQDPDEGVVVKQIAKASHEKPPGLAAFFRSAGDSPAASLFRICPAPDYVRGYSPSFGLRSSSSQPRKSFAAVRLPAGMSTLSPHCLHRMRMQSSRISAS